MDFLFFALGFVGLCALVVYLVIVVPVLRDEKKRKAARNVGQERGQAVLDQHLETLAKRRLSLVRLDHYGIEDTKVWDREVKHFFEKVVSPAGLLPDNFEEQVRRRSEKIRATMAFSPQMSPVEFEVWCSNTLHRSGWRCHTTRATGDQGADIVAEKSNVRLIVQCKLYSGAVGNKAVQEAWAAMRHYSASHAAVVTNAEFTSAARELASTTGVLLLHVSDLSDINARFQTVLAGQTS